jgi:hypothetical protein
MQVGPYSLIYTRPESQRSVVTERFRSATHNIIFGKAEAIANVHS